MVLQYKEKKENSRWKDYPGKGKIVGQPDNYYFRLLTHDKTEVLAEKGSYAKVLRRMRQIEFSKNKSGKRRLSILDGVIE